MPLLNKDHEADVSDAELVAWLSDQSVLRQSVIQKRASTNGSGRNGDGVLAKVQALDLRQRPGRMEIAELQSYADDVTAAADFLTAEATKARTALNRKLAQ